MVELNYYLFVFHSYIVILYLLLYKKNISQKKSLWDEDFPDCKIRLLLKSIMKIDMGMTQT
jgi:hypothetical protein